MHTCDIAIIGGGIIGLSCGYYLAKSGKKVTVLEAKSFGDGASGACDDMILFQSKKPGINLELSFESLRLYEELQKECGNSLGFARYGGMVLIENDLEQHIMEEFVTQQKSYGLDVSLLSKKEMHKKQPFLSERFISSTYSPMDAQIDPFEVMHQCIRGGKALGMKLLRHAPVTAIEQKGNGLFSIYRKDHEVVETPIIINAAGTWAGEIASLVSESIPITPKRGQIVVTEKIPPLGETNLWSAKYLVTKLKPELQVASSEEEQKLGLAFACTRSSGDTYLLGSTREYVGFDKKTTMEGISAIISQAVSFLPILGKVNMIRVIAGLRPSTPDGKMILGEHKNLPGFFTVAGHEGDGISLAPITGKLVSDMVCQNTISYNIAELSPNRFVSDNQEASL